uniref:Predicted protein n=1 Tax=Hordeum vulgare subsp. vulgare TaxID=112509 RepID=F2CTR5_HORVV|nr:predicted protein [Hordeum vulgare subsp. vulgare]BAK02047.1 predicted protein [Hordeum vulgare subsp. vulgare]
MLLPAMLSCHPRSNGGKTTGREASSMLRGEQGSRYLSEMLRRPQDPAAASSQLNAAFGLCMKYASSALLMFFFMEHSN